MADVITRDDIYKPVPRKKPAAPVDIEREAKATIDPKDVKPMEPSWKTDNEPFWDEFDPGHFLAFKLFDIEKRLHPDGYAEFDPRLYFKHPLDIHHYPLPKDIVTTAANASSTAGKTSASSEKESSPESSQYAFSKKVNLIELGKSGDPVATMKMQLANLDYAPDDLEGFKRDRKLTDISDDAAMTQLDSFHNNPVQEQV